MAYPRDITGVLRRDGPTGIEAVLKAIEYLITLAEYQAGGGLTFTPVKVVTEAAVPLDILAAATGKYGRLHLLVGTSVDTGTVTVEDTDGTDLTGPMNMAVEGSGFVIPFTADPRGCLVAAVGKGVSLLTTQIFNGYAVVSQGDA